MSEKLKLQKNSSVPSQMAPLPQFQQRPFTDERYHPVASATKITVNSSRNIAHASFNLLNITEQPKLATGATAGKDPTPDTIREGSVRMEQHPQYEETIGQVKAAGFEIKISNEARVEVKEVLDSDGNLIRLEKILYVQQNMRYLDLEHEVGHIKQMERFGKNIPSTQRVTEQPNGNLKAASNQDGVLTTWQNTITEYHNRLDEFIRLHERGASPELLKEHATGVEEWYQAYWKKGLKQGHSKSQKQWAEKYFSDLIELQSRYLELVKTTK